MQDTLHRRSTQSLSHTQQAQRLSTLLHTPIWCCCFKHERISSTITPCCQPLLTHPPPPPSHTNPGACKQTHLKPAISVGMPVKAACAKRAATISKVEVCAVTLCHCINVSLHDDGLGFSRLWPARRRRDKVRRRATHWTCAQSLRSVWWRQAGGVHLPVTPYAAMIQNFQGAFNQPLRSYLWHLNGRQMGASPASHACGRHLALQHAHCRPKPR